MKIIKKIATKNIDSDGFVTEINLIQGEYNRICIDIRPWSKDHKHFKAGVQYSLTDLPRLQEYIPELSEIYNKIIRGNSVI